MHFGEYELFPGLISLSPLPSSHPKIFQHLAVRSSSWCYPTFNLLKGRSPGFASTSDDCTHNVRFHFPCGKCNLALLRLAFASATYLRYLTLPTKVTRRFIMQKARSHPDKSGLLPLEGKRVQGLFHSSVRGAFHLSLTVLVHYRSLGSI